MARQVQQLRGMPGGVAKFSLSFSMGFHHVHVLKFLLPLLLVSSVFLQLANQVPSLLREAAEATSKAKAPRTRSAPKPVRKAMAGSKRP